MRTVRVLITALILILTGNLGAKADSSERIYGKITTVDGDVFEGLIRWDKNEGSWVDLLNGTKEMSEENSDKPKRTKYRQKKASIELFGLKIGDSDVDWSFSSSAESGVRFGHIRSFEVIDDDALLITLKSGKEIELTEGSTDIGGDVREIIIEDNTEGEIELVWDDIDRIDFSDAGPGRESNFGERLYGTLTTRRGDEFTGYIGWDVDEIFGSDILDGDDKGRSRKVKFEKIASIARYSSSGATVRTKNGEEIILKESNDVDESNRGIIVSDVGFGQVTVQWDEFDKVVFSDQRPSIKYGSFDGGRPLKGTVYTEDGGKYVGAIRWDNDEEYTWEILDGNYRDIEFDIEFGLVKDIVKKSSRSVTVTVWDGRAFRLRDSNDVDDGNKGIFVKTDAGEEIEIDWEDFERVEFSKM